MSHVCFCHLSVRVLCQVLLPISDSESEASDSGSHWTLLACFKACQNENAAFHCLHLNSQGCHDCPNLSHATRVARLLFGDATTVEAVSCAKQKNGFDCGVFVIRFAQLIVSAYLKAGTVLKFRLDTSWRRALGGCPPLRRHSVCYLEHKIRLRSIMWLRLIWIVAALDLS